MDSCVVGIKNAGKLCECGQSEMLTRVILSSSHSLCAQDESLYEMTQYPSYGALNVGIPTYLLFLYIQYIYIVPEIYVP